MKLKYFLSGVVLLTTAIFCQAQDNYTAALKKYFEASGSAEAFKTAVTGMMANFKNMNAQVPEEFWKEMENEMLKTSIDELVTLMVPVYKTHLSEQDLKEIIKFYESSVGKKLAQKTPVITQESMQAGQQWGQVIAGKVMKKMQEKGYK